MEIRVGTSGYAYREWKGTFYPEKIPPGDMLRFYSGRFNTVEINTTFYRMPGERVLISWAEQVPGDFVFALKAPRVITHLKQLRNVYDEAAYFFRTLSVLDARLGPVLFQFPKSFRASPPLMKDFLGLIPAGRDCAFEFRSVSRTDDEILNLLRERGSCLCIADADEHPSGEIIPTAPWGYLRLRRSDYSDADLKQWLERIGAQKWEKVFVFFKHEEEAKGPELATRFREFAES